MAEVLFGGIPVSVLTDSYKAGHFKMYPDAEKMVAVSRTLNNINVMT
jgi:hypothetical protein